MADIENPSDFNAATTFLSRLNDYWAACGFYQTTLDAHGWFTMLNRIYIELADDMKETKSKEMWDKIKKVKPKVDDWQELCVRMKRKVPIDFELYNDLKDLEIELRKIYSQAGYKTRYADDPRFAR